MSFIRKQHVERTVIIAAAAAAILLIVACDVRPGSASQPSRQTSVPAVELVRLSITSDPSGATVSIDNRARGQTPLEVEVPKGRIEYHVSADEPHEEYDLYKPYSSVLDVQDDIAIDVWIPRTTAEEQEQAIGAYRLQQARARLQELQSIVRSSPWRYVERIDAMTDEDSSFVTTPATTWPSYYDDAYMTIRCDDSDPTASDGIAIIIDADTYLGSRDLPLDWRFDTNPPVSRQQWRASTEGTALFNLSYKSQFLRALDGSRELRVRIYDYRGTSHDYTFDVSQAREAIELLGCYRGTALN